MKKKRMSRKKALGIFVPSLTVVLASMVSIGVLSNTFSDSISIYLNGGNATIDSKTLKENTELVEDIVKEGSVLLKNDNHALPLSVDEAKKINIFGWASYDWMTSMFGSGYSNTSLKKYKLYPALEEMGIEYNTQLYDMYRNFYSGKASGWGMSDLQEYRGDIAVGNATKFILHEPGRDYYTPEVINHAKEFSDVALVVIGRTGGEAADLRKIQVKQQQSNNSSSTITDSTRTYLQLSTEEEEMIAAAKQACKKVIVLLNTSNTMELGFVQDEGISACMLTGLTGLTGVKSVINLLRGVDEEGNICNPSGRTADIYAYDISTNPSSINSGYGGAKKYLNLPTSNSYTKNYYDAYIDYMEGIYVGYRYYETAAVENYISYDQTIQYPFGYGLSYTSFDWSIEKVELDNKDVTSLSDFTLEKNSTLKVYVNVTNTGEVEGQDVIELYYTAPYYQNGIEKSSVVLGDFKKTSLLKPHETGGLILELSCQDMASYDAYDDNHNNFKGYELDEGSYSFKLMENSHVMKELSSASRRENSITANIPTHGYQYDKDKVTGNKVENQFTGEDTIDGYSLDGQDETREITYLSRSNFRDTFPTEIITRERNEDAYEVASSTRPTEKQLQLTGYDDVEMPDTSINLGLEFNDLLEIYEFDSDDYLDLVSQMSKKELFRLIRDGFFKTQAIESIKKPIYRDLDGPLGLNTRVTSSTSCSFVSYPSETLLAQTWNIQLAYSMGLSVGNEATSDPNNVVKGWYGPACNIHRNPFDGRNGEYYSEDPLLSGKMAAMVVKGAKNKGLYCYLKHFAANESESLREGLYTFMTEQTLREIYLRPFELAVKEGGANALMTSMNRLGACWTGASYALCHNVLREEWGFRGSLVTDWVDTGSTYMPVYKGIWAGNDIWLNNAEATKMFNDQDVENDPVFVTLAQNVAHDVLYTAIDTQQTALDYDPDKEVGDMTKGGFAFDTSWKIYVVLVEVVLGLGFVTLAFFLAKNLYLNTKLIKAE